jgi:hypothetical protein
MRELAVAADGGRAGAVLLGGDGFRYRTVWQVEKWSEEAVQFARDRLWLPSIADVSSAALRKLGIRPEQVDEIEGNLLLNEGIGLLLDLAIGAGGTPWDAAHARLGVGDATTAEAATQTDLQASTNKVYKAMNATYPSRAAQTVTWQSDFGSSDANFAWNEWSIDNGNVAGINLNRKVQSFGTKATGTWTLTGQVQLS